jgi:hypothetical protein
MWPINMNWKTDLFSFIELTKTMEESIMLVIKIYNYIRFFYRDCCLQTNLPLTSDFRTRKRIFQQLKKTNENQKRKLT